MDNFGNLQKNNYILESKLNQKTKKYFDAKLKETKGKYFGDDLYLLHIDLLLYDRCLKIVDKEIQQLCLKLWDILLDTDNNSKVKRVSELGKEVFELGGVELQKEIAFNFCSFYWQVLVLRTWIYD